MTTFIEEKDFHGTQKVRILRGIVAGGKPRQVGEIVELPAFQGYELIAAGKAEPFVPAPAFKSLK